MRHFKRKAAVLAAATVGLIPLAHGANTTWNGNTDTFWASPNWTLDTNNAYAPVANDALFFDATATTGTTLFNNIAAGTSFNGITFNVAAPAYIIDGNAIVLGGALAANTNGIANNSANTQTVNLGLTLATGNHAFVGGTGLALNPTGGLLRDTAAVATFSGPITTTTITNNSAGILGGWATVGADWATVSGGSIIALPAESYTTVNGAVNISNPGTPSGANLRWTGVATGATIGSTGATTNLNTINFTDSAGVTVNLTGTLLLGAQGGIYRSNSAANANTQISGGAITAGGAASTPGEIVFTVNQSGGNNSNNLQINSAIADNGGSPVRVVKTGPGSLVMNNANNSFTGGMFIEQGRVQLSNVNGYGPAGNTVTILPGGQSSLAFTATTNALNWRLGGLGSQETNGLYGALRLNNNQNSIIAGTITLLANTRFSASGGNGGGISAKITGPFGIELGGSGAAGNAQGLITILNTTNDYAGDTMVSTSTSGNSGAATLSLGASGVIPDSSNVVLNAGNTNANFNLNGKNETIAGLNSSGDATKAFVTNTGGATSMLIVGNGDTSGSFFGSLQAGTATLGITKIGTGTQVLGGNNVHTGTTLVQNGTLKMGSSTGLTASTSVTLGSGVTSGVLDLNGFAATVAGLSTSGSGVSNIVGNSSTTSAATLNVATGSSSFGGRIQNTLGAGNQTVALNQSSGTLILTGNNTYTGDTTVAGALVVTGSLASTGNVAVNTGGMLSGSGDGSATGRVGNVTLNGGSIRPGASAADGNTGTLALSSLNVNSGEFRLDLGAGSADKINVIGAANFSGSSSITLGSIPAAGTYTLLTALSLTGNAPAAPAGSGNARTTFNVNFDTVGNKIQLIVAGSPLTITWTGTNGSAWDLHTTANWTDATTASDKYFDLDTVVFGNGPTNRTVQLDFTAVPSAVNFTNTAGNDYTIQGGGGIGDSGLTGGTALTISGGGKVTLGTANTYLGPTSVQNGTLVLNNGSALPTNTKLRLGSGANSGAVDLNGNSITVSELSTTGNGAGNLIGNGGGGQSTINYNGASSTFGGVIQDMFGGVGSSVALTLNSGTLVLTGNNTYTGQTNINTGAALQLGTGGATGAISLENVNNNGLLIFSRDGTLVVTGNIQGNGATQINSGTVQVGAGTTSGQLSSGTITNSGTLVFNRSDDITIPIVNGSGTIRKKGTGVATFGANTYTGNTIIENGKAVPTGAAAFGPASGGSVSVLSGGAIDVIGFPTANLNPGFAGKQFFVEGTGPDGNGAILNSGGLSQLNAFTVVTLTNDALFNTNSRLDVRGLQAQATVSGTLNLNGKTLTKIGGGSLTFAAIDVKDGNVVINAGTLAIEGATQMLDFGTGKTVTFNATSGEVALALFQNSSNGGNVTRPMVFNNLGGTVRVLNPGNSNATALGSSGTLNGALTFDVTQPLTWNGNLNNGTVAGSITKINGGVLTLGGASNGYTGGTTLNSGTLITNTNFSNGTLAISGGNAQVSQKTANIDPAGTTVVPAISVGGALDLTNNALIVDYIGPSPVNDIRSALANGFAGGNWNGGGGINSSTAATYNAANTTAKRAVGFSEASALGKTSFAGRSVDPSSVLVAYTVSGDANLDFKVNALDFNAVATNFGAGGTNFWNQGDFNYDGQVDPTDFTLLGQNFNVSLPANAPAPVLGSLVPEPATLSMMAVATMLVGRRRRR